MEAPHNPYWQSPTSHRDQFRAMTRQPIRIGITLCLALGSLASAPNNHAEPALIDLTQLPATFNYKEPTLLRKLD